MAINLEKGQSVEIGLKHLVVGLGWDPAETGEDFDLDATACLLGENMKLPQDEFFVFYNNPESPDGSCASTCDDGTGDNSDDGDDEQIVVDLTKVDGGIRAIVFGASIYEAEERGQVFEQAKRSYIRICNAETNEELCRYELNEDFSVETAIEFGQLLLCDGEWKFEATGIGHRNGLQGIVDKYS